MIVWLVEDVGTIFAFEAGVLPRVTSLLADVDLDDGLSKEALIAFVLILSAFDRYHQDVK